MDPDPDPDPAACGVTGEDEDQKCGAKGVKKKESVWLESLMRKFH